MKRPETFDLGGALPAGRLAIEASAGTGKTFTLAALAARFVAEADVPISELLIVTFTRAAAAELKDRVRARLVEVARALQGDGGTTDALLADLTADDRADQLRRVLAAIADFDAATITTIHGFAQQVLGSLGSTVPTDLDAVLVDDTSALIAQVATDLLTAEAVRCEHPPEDVPDHATLVGDARLALGNPDACLVPDPEEAGSTPAASLRRRLVDGITQEVGRRRRAAGSLSFDDLLGQLRDALVDHAAGPAARRQLRRRFRVALIDEFQDTDPVQWEIFECLFGNEEDLDPDERPTTLILVGDPKQAIYGFRGANVHTFLQAAHAEGTQRAELDTNWRSDGGLLRALDVLLTGTTFGDDRISFQQVQAQVNHRDRRITTAGGDPLPTLSVRLTIGPGVARHKKRPQFVTADPGREATYADLAVHVRDLLESAQIPDEHGNQDDSRPLRPDDVAVLIAAGWEGPLVRGALTRLGIPAVIARGDNVLESEAATQWHHLLHALARPADPRRARALALSWFVGEDAAQLIPDDSRISALQEQLHRWAEQLGRQGLASFLSTVRAETGVAARVLAGQDGDRTMTDLDHVAELLQLASPPRVSAAMLLSTFEQLAGGDGMGDPDADLAARRIESEARAVQIMTTYVAKGLEFPVVCCPSLWATTPVDKVSPVFWDASVGKRTVDVAGNLPWPDEETAGERQALARVEAVGSNLRVLYVALTRARHHTALWWVPVEKAGATGLARVLFARTTDGVIDPEAFTATSVAPPADTDAMIDALAPLVDAADGRIEVVPVDRPDASPRPWIGVATPPRAALQVATLDHAPDRARGRWSFTAVTARAHGEYGSVVDPLDDSVGDAGAADEQLTSTPAEADQPSEVPGGDHPVMVPGTDLPLGDIAGGSGFGTLVHEVLERVDFTTAELESELAAAVADRLAWNPWPVDAGHLVQGLAAVVRTPLGPQFAGRALAQMAPRDRLDEMAFDLTLGERGERATDAQVGRLLLTHLDRDDPLHGWATRLATGPFSAVLAGHLTGSIDLVARVRHDNGEDRFVVVDYKTNRLALAGLTPTSDLFRPERLVGAMADHDYVLQALLYTVALHRYLRWRLPQYEPATHLGGIGYMFLRGMVGPGTETHHGTPNGLFSWQPPAALVTELSDLLDGAGLPGGVSP